MVMVNAKRFLGLPFADRAGPMLLRQHPIVAFLGQSVGGEPALRAQFRVLGPLLASPRVGFLPAFLVGDALAGEHPFSIFRILGIALASSFVAGCHRSRAP
jgi:hypothetical protein